MSTADLVRHALAEAKLLARAEIHHAKLEVKQELSAARSAAIWAVASILIGICGLSALFISLALALPIPAPVGALGVGLILLAVAAGLGALARKRMPRRPVPRTQDRLKLDLAFAKEQLT